MLKWFGFGNGVVSEMLQFFKNDVFKAKKKISSAASDFCMLYWDQCNKPIKWFSSSLMVPSLPFLMLQSYPNFWFYPSTWCRPNVRPTCALSGISVENEG